MEIHTDQSMKLFKTDRLQLPTYAVKTVEELAHVIEQEFYRSDKGKKRNGQRREKLQSYTQKYFYKFDGLRCYEHAREIANFIEDTCRETQDYGEFFVKHPKLLLSYAISQIRRPLSHAKRFLKSVFWGSATWKADESNEIINHPDIGTSGKYDNCIKPGDEEYWFEKFEKAGFRVEDFENLYLACLGNKENMGGG